MQHYNLRRWIGSLLFTRRPAALVDELLESLGKVAALDLAGINVICDSPEGTWGEAALPAG